MNICVQSVLYNLPYDNIIRSLAYLDNAARNARETASIHEISVAYGDCSPEPSINAQALTDLRQSFPHLTNVSYQYFDGNLGSARGHNELLKSHASDLVMILNPDVLAAPNLIGEMVGALSQPGVGMVEARQLPIEHPKYYDPVSGETSWASTACAMAPRKIFDELKGFDADSFFLYCDDVDFSWRVRLAGHRVVHECAAVVFHDKRLTDNGEWISSSAERYYSAEAALLLTYKFSRSDLTEKYLEFFSSSGDPDLQRAHGAFELRRKTGRLPLPIDSEHRVGQFVDGAYAPHRFKSR